VCCGRGGGCNSVAVAEGPGICGSSIENTAVKSRANLKRNLVSCCSKRVSKRHSGQWRDIEIRFPFNNVLILVINI